MGAVPPSGGESRIPPRQSRSNGFRQLISAGFSSRFLLNANGVASKPAWGIAPGNVKSKGRKR
jgi:hypothetical protein